MSEIVIILILILLNGVFAMAEIALVSARKSGLQSSAKRGSSSARLALKLAEEPDRFLSTVQIGITLIGIVTGIYSGAKIAEDFAPMLVKIGIPVSASNEIAQVIIVAVVTYLTLIFGELLPKRIGMGAAESVAKFMARPMHLLSVVASPFVWILSKSTALLVKLLRIDSKGSKVTEEEIKSIVKEGAEVGEVQEVEQDIVERVFLMGDMNVDSIMTQRRDLIWFDADMNRIDIRAIINEGLHEAYPVAEGDLDHLIGFVTMKDLVFELEKDDFSLRNILRAPAYFYENMSVYKVLETMKREGISRGIVCDEFGSCVGVVTLKDIMMGLVGSVDEGKDAPKHIMKRPGGEEWLVDGQCYMHEFLDYFESGDLYSNEEYTTVAGLCLKELGHIPNAGESFIWHTFTFEIADMDGARIDKLLVRLNNDTNN